LGTAPTLLIYDNVTSEEPSLIIAVSSANGCGWDMNLFADNLGEQW
jgi:hypothetical protein